MIIKRNQNDRGSTHTDWLNSRHSFSFGEYFDEKHMGFGVLRVINDDRVIPSAGFATHPHRNMEIISYVLKGELAHKDNMGNGSVIKPGEVQIMSAGSGITHSEYNASNTEELHFLQIWIFPNRQNEPPNYQQKFFAPEEMHNKFRVVVSADEENQSLRIKQDARMMAGKFDQGQSIEFHCNPKRRYWLQMVQGCAYTNEKKVLTGDGLAIENEGAIQIDFELDSELLFFDLPK